MKNQIWERQTRRNRRMAIVFTILLHLGIVGGLYYSSNPDMFMATETTEVIEVAKTDAP